jgi:3-mercaptopyruvate sulfurtransferase SseA
MIILKSDYFSSHERLTRFINENGIKRDDILVITQDQSMFTIFFYADDAGEEITHGLFS